MENIIQPISFIDYDRVSDTLMFFKNKLTLTFNVILNRKINGRVTNFHREILYNDEHLNKDGLMIKRNINCFFCINDGNDFTNNVAIYPQDIISLRYLMDNKILPWFTGNKPLFRYDNNNMLIIKGKYTPAEFMVSDYKYISFIPIIIDFENGTFKEGLRMYVNSQSNYIDITFDKFLEFYYYINNTDMYTAAITILNYVKMSPYGINCYDVIRNQEYNQN